MEDARDSDGLEVWGRELPAHGGGPPDGQSSVCDEESGPSIEPDTFASMFHPEGAADSADLRGWSPVYCPGAVPSCSATFKARTGLANPTMHCPTFLRVNSSMSMSSPACQLDQSSEKKLQGDGSRIICCGKSF